MSLAVVEREIAAPPLQSLSGQRAAPDIGVLPAQQFLLPDWLLVVWYVADR